MSGDEETEDQLPQDDVSLVPNDASDPKTIVDSKVPEDIRDKYEVFSYRNAAVILTETRKREFAEILDALRSFSIDTTTIRKAGGNETDIPKFFSTALEPLGWHETRINNVDGQAALSAECRTKCRMPGSCVRDHTEMRV